MSEWCAVPILLSSIANIVAKSEQIAPDWLTIIGSIVMLLAFIINIIKAIKLGKSFGKGIGFKIGLVLLPDIFQIILGLDSSKYVGPFVS